MTGWIILIVLAALIAVLLIRAARFTPQEEKIGEAEPVEFDRDKAVTNLQALIRCKTVSNINPEREDDAEFEKLIALLPELFPHFWAKCPLTRMQEGRGLLFKWEGESHDAPSVMMSHYDVVPVDEAAWTKPPFDAVIEDGVLYGRGAIDTKNTLSAALTAADHLIAQGFCPKQDVYFAFSGSEEIDGRGAPSIVEWFKAHGVKPALVVDEGGAVVKDIFPGVHEDCGMIGIAEKGMMNLVFSASSDGGHASSPKPGSPLVRLSKVCLDMEKHPYKFHISKAAEGVFDTLARRSGFALRILFANMWLFGGAFDLVCRKSGGVINALARTTVAFTQAEGSNAFNVIPPRAEMLANLRINPGDSVEDVIAYAGKRAAKYGVEVSTRGNRISPSTISEVDCAAWDKVASSVRDTWSCIPVPYLMVQGSDSRHYSDISNHVYRFSAAYLTDEQRESIHSNDEQTFVESVRKAAEFYIRLLRQC